MWLSHSRHSGTSSSTYRSGVWWGRVQALGEGLQYTQTSLDAANAFVVMLKAAASDEDRTVRVSVYYATGTVAVEYKEAHEQWGFRPAAFHWGCSLEMLSRLLQV